MVRQEGARARFTSGQWERLRSWELFALVPFYVPLYAGRELLRHRGTILASTLAFVTALSLVPLLSVGASVLAGLNLLDREGGALQPYLQRLFPASASDIAEQLDAFAANGAADVAGVGSIAFLIIGVFLFVAIERVFNTLWSSERERPWLQKSFAFVTLMTFGPALALASFTISARSHFRASQFAIDPTVLDLVLPLALGLVLFTAMNHFLPTGRVRWWASLLAGSLTAASFELVKWGFNLYISEIVLVPYSQAYGTLGLFPLFLVWLYLTWVVVLAGAALAYVSQHLRTLVTIEAAQQRSQGRDRDHVFNPLVALELYAPIARAFKTGEGRISEKDLLKRTGYSEAVVRSVVAQLAAIGALDVVEDDAGERRLLPAKQLDDIKLLPIVDSFFDFEQPANSLPMAKLLQGYRAVTLEVLRSEDALSLIAQDDELGQRYAQMKPWDPLPASTLSRTSSTGCCPTARGAVRARTTTTRGEEVAHVRRGTDRVSEIASEVGAPTPTRRSGSTRAATVPPETRGASSAPTSPMSGAAAGISRRCRRPSTARRPEPSARG
mgnify:CR=1 FL=1